MSADETLVTGDGLPEAEKPQDPRSAGDLVGRRLLHFHVVERLGEGGMGIVYKAVDEKLGRSVAIKVLATRYLVDDRNKAMIFREARSAASVQHPNIATIHEVHDEGGTAFLVMELVVGESLRARLERGPLVLDEALAICRQIAEGLAQAHEAGVVHRDLKPENVMITKDGRVKLLDFGVAKVIDVEESDVAQADDEPSHAPAPAPTMAAFANSTAVGRVLGTPAYMAPEQARGEVVDARADVFAFGVLLYELLTGKVAFPRRDGKPWTWGDGKSGDWTPHARVRALAPHVPRAVEKLVVGCLAFAREGRLADGNALRVALEESARLANRARWQTRFAASIAIAGVLALALLIARSRASSAPAALAPAAARSADGSHALVRLIDLPPPESKNQEALREYRGGIRALYDASFFTAIDAFRRAVALDDELAEGHLRLAVLTADLDDSGARRHLERAVLFRSKLRARDAALLDVARQVIFTRAPQPGLAARLPKELAARFPNDVELAYSACTIFGDDPGDREGLACLENVRHRDPDYSLVLWSIAGTHLTLGDFDAARAAAHDCLRQSPAAASCVNVLALAASDTAHCDELVEAGRLRTDVEPNGARGPDLMARGSASQGAPREALEDLLQRKWKGFPPDQRDVVERMDQARVDVLFGDFGSAISRLRSFRDSIATRDSEPLQAAVWGALIAAHLEAGETATAHSEARRFWAKRSQWSDSDSLEHLVVRPHDSVLWIARIMVRLGALSRESFEDVRRRWLAVRRVRTFTPVTSTAYAWPVETRAEAEEAWPVVEREEAQMGGLSGRGKLLALLGRSREAVPQLRTEVARCEALPYPLEQTQMMGYLGRALEETGDAAGACAAYAAVLERWGKAKPRSVTADLARTRRSALHCAE